MKRCIARFAAVLSLSLVTQGGCSFGGHDECERGSDHCAGNTLMICESCSEFGCGNEWSVSECKACVEPQGWAPFCALSAQPDPRCDRNGYCDGDSAARCDLGYVVAIEDCATTSLVCVEGELNAHCVPSHEPDPVCVASDDPIGVVCDGSTLKSCNQGYAVNARACPEACATPDNYEPLCATSTEPDPLCSTGSGYCEGSTLIECRFGFAARRVDCTTMGVQCIEYDSGAYCDAPVDEHADAGES